MERPSVSMPPGVSASRGRLSVLLSGNYAVSDRAGDAGTAEPAVAVRVLREVLLVVRLGVVERPGRRDLGRDLAVAGALQLCLEHVARRLGGRALRVVGRVDRGAVLRAGVVALAHPLR